MMLDRTSSKAGPGSWALALVFLAAGSALAQGRIELDRLQIDLGRLNRGEVGTVRFELRNTGEVVLRIEDAIPACDCTVASFDETIDPGEFGFLTATLDTTGYRGFMVRQIELRTSDPNQRSVTLELHAEILTSVLLLPSQEMFLRTRPAQPMTARVLVRQDPTETGRLELSDLTTSVDWLIVDAERLDAPRPAGAGLPEVQPGDWLVEVRVGERPEFGTQKQTLTFKTGLTREPTVTIPIDLELIAPVNLSVEKLVLARGSPVAVLALSVRSGLDPDSLTVESRPPGMRVELRRAGERMYHVLVDATGLEPSGDAALLFAVDGGRLSLPVEWRDGGP